MPTSATSPIHLIRAAFGVMVELRQVPWAPGYFVSTDGDVFSTRWWRGEPKVVVRRLKITKSFSGYGLVSLRSNGRTTVAKVHLLVLNVFIGPPPSNCECCHNNGDRMDNHLSNLRWDTKSSNSADRLLHGTDCNGERNGRAVLTEEDVRLIRSTPKVRGWQARLARRFGVNRITIKRALDGDNWK